MNNESIKITLIKVLEKGSFFRKSSSNMIRWRNWRYVTNFVNWNNFILKISLFSKRRSFKGLHEFLRFDNLGCVSFRILIWLPGRIHIISYRRGFCKIFRSGIANALCFSNFWVTLLGEDSFIRFIGRSF